MNRVSHDAGDAQALASDPATSAWVSAHAGSGKTHVLVNRVIRLLLSGAEPERILCLTFTRAAAAEMARRLFKELAGWIALDDIELAKAVARLGPDRCDLDAARRLFARALETPGGLKIQTIHAFCERLLQRFPVEAGVAPGFKVLDEQEAAALLAEARGEVVAAASKAGGEASEALDCIVAHVGEEGLDELLQELLGKRSELQHLLADELGREAALLSLCRFLGIDPEDRLDDIARAAMDFDRIACAEAAAALSSVGGRCATSLKAVLDKSADGYRLLKSLYLKRDGKRRADQSILSAAAQRSCPDAADFVLAEADRIAALAEKERCLSIRDATQALLAIADAIIGRYEAKKLRLARYDYDDLIDRTLSLFRELESAAWVLYRLDGGLDHILLDEAQDTSREQWEIIRDLASEFFAGEGQREGVERTLFAVGDRKQSIFSFQGADPDAFDEMERHFRERIRAAERRFSTVPLQVSFRSTHDILAAVDAVFASSPAADGVVTPSLGVLAHKAHRGGEPGLIEIWEPVPRVKEEKPSRWTPGARGNGEAKPRVLLAERIAKLIRRWLDEGERIASTGELVRPGDILILLRQRTTFMTMLVKALKQQAIPVAGVDRLELAEHIAVQDLLSLIRFVLLPEDDLALAELLKSPLARRDDGASIEDEDLLRIAPDRGGRNLWTALRLGVADGQPYADALARIERWAARADYEPPFEFLAGVLTRDRGRRMLLERLGPEAGEPIDALLSLALDFASGEAASLRGFLTAMEEEGVEIKRETDQRSEAVRVMTVHGAKGLEAPIVILPDTCDPPTGRHDDSILMTPLGSDGGRAAVWRLKASFEPAAMENLRRRHQQRAREEYNRLLYVAMTRARDRLYVCGALSGSTPDDRSWYKLIHDALKPLAKQFHAADGTHAGWRIDGRPDRPPPRPAEKGANLEVSPLPAWALAPAPDEPPAARWLIPSRLGRPTEADREAASSPLSDGESGRFRRGRLLHRLLQMLPDLAHERRREAGVRYLRRAAADMEDAEQMRLLDEAMAILERPELAPLFGHGSVSEVPIAARLDDGVRLTGRIDRLLVTDREVLVADYKTNRPPPKTLEDIEPAHLRQLAAYRRALASLHADRPVRCVLIWTDGPRVMEIPAERLEAVFLHA